MKMNDRNKYCGSFVHRVYKSELYRFHGFFCLCCKNQTSGEDKKHFPVTYLLKWYHATPTFATPPIKMQ